MRVKGAAKRHQPSQPSRSAAAPERDFEALPKSRSPERDIQALLDFIESRHDVPHAWGKGSYSPGPTANSPGGNDCIAFCGHAVEALTGGRRRPLRGLQWNDERSGLKLLAELGGVEAALDARFRRIAPGRAMRGDLGGIADRKLGLHPMIVEGELLVGPGDKGNRRMPRSAMIAAWDVTSRPVRKKKVAEGHVTHARTSPGRTPRE